LRLPSKLNCFVMFYAALLLAALLQQASIVGAGQVAKLAVYVSPPILPADGGRYACVYVQIQDLDGRPLPAPSRVNVTLASSNLDVGAVTGWVVIDEGETFAVAFFNTTFKPGLTVIAASAQGFMSGFAALVTVNPSGASPPFKLNVYVQSPMPSKAGLSGVIAVQAVGSNGLPLFLPVDVNVTLASSNVTVIDVPSFTVIPSGACYAKASFTVKGAPGKSIVTAMADGFLPGSAEVAVRNVGGKPSKLLLTLTPPVLTPDGGMHEGAVQIQLLDGAGAPAAAAGDIQIYVSTSNPDVCVLSSPITLRGGEYFVSANVRVGVKVGDSVVTAAASGLEAASSMLHVSGLTPSKLAVYAAPPVVPADGKPKNILAVQVQDANGVPVASNRDIYVHLSSSSPRIGYAPPLLTVRRGESMVVAPFIPSILPGIVNITASAQGLEAASVTIETWVPTLSLTVEAPSTVFLNQTFNVKAYVSYGGLPVEGASVEWTVSGAEVIDVGNVTDADGCVYVTLKQKTEKTILTVRVFKHGFSDAKAVKVVSAIASIERQPSLSVFGFEIPILTLAVALAVLVAILIVAYMILKFKFRRLPGT